MAPHFKNDLNIYNELMHLSELIPTIYSLLLSKLSLMAAMSGIVYASRLLSVTPLAGQGYELDAIASAVIGGTSVSGGEGSVVRTLIGALLLTMITNAFNLIGIDLYVQYVFKGLVILAAVGFDSFYKARG